MGYPMSWQRLRNRNGLWGSYRQPKEGEYPNVQSISGDAERVEQDTMDGRHLEAYAALAGENVGIDQMARVFRAFFSLPEPDCGKCIESVEKYPDNRNAHRCSFHQQWRWPSR